MDEKGNIEKEKIDDYITQQEFKEIISNFEKEIEEFDQRTEGHSRQLEEIEKEISKVPFKLAGIHELLENLFNDIHNPINYESSEKFEKDDKNKNSVVCKNVIIFVFLIIIIILSVFIFL